MFEGKAMTDPKAVHRTHLLKDVNPDDVDTLLANELRQMDFKTRDEVQEELHGVRNLAKDESPEMIARAMHQLELEVQAIPQKDAFNESQTHPNTYVNTYGFRLKFLRVDVFNEKLAAIRMVKFLDMVRDYFGPEALIRPPRMSDLGKAEMELLRSGGEQLLPSCDRSGRRILIFIGSHGKGYSVYSRVRCLFHWRDGLVSCCYANHSFSATVSLPM